MRTFEEFLKEESDEGEGFRKGIRKAIGGGKTTIERGSHWLHAQKTTDTKDELVMKMDKETGVQHTLSAHGKPQWETKTHKAMMHQHGDGHYFIQVFKHS